MEGRGPRMLYGVQCLLDNTLPPFNELQEAEQATFAVNCYILPNGYTELALEDARCREIIQQTYEAVRKVNHKIEIDGTPMVERIKELDKEKGVRPRIRVGGLETACQH